MITHLLKFDALAIISIALICFIAAIVGFYSKNYLRGDSKRHNFFLNIFLLTLFLITTFSADNIIVLCCGWLLSNVMLVVMMIYKSSWRQAFNSGMLALKNFVVGAITLSIALTILHLETGSYAISEIVVSKNISPESLLITTLLLSITALSQAGIYPFHSWLISSLNSPTPTSALMHAGLVNGGGILLARFSPLFFQVPQIMTAIFIIGMFSALIGTLWKLMQNNVKAMLACSTMSQMGFMIAQCGMGLFSAAIAHLLWHGMFKSYLFLSASGSWRDKRIQDSVKPSLKNFLCALLCGLCGSMVFAQINGFSFNNRDTTIILLLIAFIGASQMALTIISQKLFRNFFPALIISVAASAFYATSVVLIEKALPNEIFQPQQLNIYHIIAAFLLFAAWFGKLFWRENRQITRQFFLKLYVKLLNSSLPSSSTITANRNQYNFR